MKDLHTQGPWRFDEDFLTVKAENNFLIAQIPIARGRGKEFIEDMASIMKNGALVAAAPELLAALQTSLKTLLDIGGETPPNKYFGVLTPAIDAAREAITKATGESA